MKRETISSALPPSGRPRSPAAGSFLSSSICFVTA
ncbi:hypothetical protein DNTS_032628 [Danionella cerebrum]|uniref:Uncharacterized protein n=1 Tax=Danionella cerebrum TaxID=2873325 RepID=A0A553QXW1_9TELE|nr:hypothetical protein DNTS_032628 [Danionella translucida]